MLADRLERLDYASPRRMGLLGLATGLALAVALLSFLSFPWAAAGCITSLVATTLFGLSGRSIRVDSLVMEPEQPPAGLPDPPHPVTPRDLWVDLAGGTFSMGSPKGEEGHYADEGPVHRVTVSPFQIMRVPVTRRLYRQIVGNDPGWPKEAGERPANNVSWNDAVRFCNALSEAEGLQPCYEEVEGQDSLRWLRDRDGYRLPTEAEWEFACRAGTATRYSFGDDKTKLEAFAWFRANSGGEPQPVGQLEANAWGLYDLHGNVYEWCWDWFGPYMQEAVTDPAGPPKGSSSVLRGGSFWGEPRDVRSALRSWVRPGDRFRDIGFRCVRGPHPQLGPLTH